jgi:hypothetical protein
MLLLLGFGVDPIAILGILLIPMGLVSAHAIAHK